MKSFEEVPVWRAGRELVKRIYGRTRKGAFRGDPGLCDQIQRAAVSVTSNIAEGHERGTTQDLIQFLFYAKGSAGEVRSQLWNAEDLGYVTAAEGEELRAFCRDISRQLSAWIQSMQTAMFKGGPKYHKESDRIWERFPSGRVCDASRMGGTGWSKRVAEIRERKTGKRKDTHAYGMC